MWHSGSILDTVSFFSFSSRESLLERERTERRSESWGWQLHSFVFSVWWCERAVHGGGGGGRQFPSHHTTGTSTQGNREEQSYLGSSSHSPAQGHCCQTWKGTAISLHSPKSSSTFLLQTITLPGWWFLNRLRSHAVAFCVSKGSSHLSRSFAHLWRKMA